MPEPHSRVYGIDLGTTFSCIAYVDEATGSPVVVPNAENDRTTASVVLFDEGGRVIVGKVARAESALRPARVVEMVKRQTANENWLFSADGRDYRAEEISGLILRKVVGDAERRLGLPVRDVVITHPAWFGVPQREATARAGELAGLNVLRVIAEPVAAAVAYGADRAERQVLLVYDLGGGTFDATMIDTQGREVKELGTRGDDQLGGRDWDNSLFLHLANEYADRTGDETLLDAHEAVPKLQMLAEQLKFELSQHESATTTVRGPAGDVPVTVTRAFFEELTAPLIERTVSLCRELITDAAARGHRRLDRIVLVGGSTRMPQVARRLKEEFGRPVESFDPDEAIAKGAALYAWKLSLDAQVTEAVAAETGGEVDLIRLDDVEPAVVAEAQKQVAEEMAEELRLPPAAVEKAVDEGRKLRVRPSSVKSFGIVAQTKDGRETVSNLILRGRTLPADETRQFRTMEDDQDTIDVRLMENLADVERCELKQSKEIGRTRLDLPPGLKAGSPVRVTFRLTEQGRLEATAEEPGSGRACELAVETAGALSDEATAAARKKSSALRVS